MKGLFIAFEGGEGAGKTTQAKLLAATLMQGGHNVVITREPGGTWLGTKLRALLLGPEGGPSSPLAEALLFAADRAEHVHTKIRPALERGDIVVCDRYVDSSVAFQGFGRQLGAALIGQVSEWATGGLDPDLVVLLDIAPTTGLRRAYARNPFDRIESEELAFHDRVRTGFRTRAQTHPHRYLVLDAGQAEGQIASVIAARVEQLLSTRNIERSTAAHG